MLPSTIAPGTVQKRSQMLSSRPARPPSIWNDDVAAPHTKSVGNRSGEVTLSAAVRAETVEAIALDATSTFESLGVIAVVIGIPPG